MIVYKWVYKKKGKYYSLLNFGYFRLNKSILISQAPYEIGETYINNKIQTENIKKQYLEILSFIPSCVKTGFYFWKKNLPINTNTKKYMQKLGADINCTLKCKINTDDILSFEQGGNCIRTSKFKVLKEANNVK